MTVDYIVGDVFVVLATIPDASVSLIATSPPFLALRSYLPDGHASKGAEIGSEANPAAFLDTLLALTVEWGRVLAPWGSIAIELGDTYAGSGGGGGDYGPKGLRDGQATFDGSAARTRSNRPGQYGSNTGPPRKDISTGGWPRPKCLALIPQAYALSLAYGINVLTGQPSPAGRWLVRNQIVWHRPNPAVGALCDKVRPSTSYITVATRSSKRWFDLDAVRGAHVNPRYQATNGQKASTPSVDHQRGTYGFTERTTNPAGVPPLDCWFDEWDGTHDTWTLTTQPSRLAHFAMWPAKLAERLILMMCPEHVCTVCGEPRRRMTGPAEYVKTQVTSNPSQRGQTAGVNGPGSDPSFLHGRANKVVNTIGWSDCGHGGQWHPGTVLDPFAGTGTTLAVADYHGRDAIGIDLDARNRDIYSARREEVARALNPTHTRIIAGQLDMFGEPA